MKNEKRRILCKLYDPYRFQTLLNYSSPFLVFGARAYVGAEVIGAKSTRVTWFPNYGGNVLAFAKLAYICLELYRAAGSNGIPCRWLTLST